MFTGPVTTDPSAGLVSTTLGASPCGAAGGTTTTTSSAADRTESVASRRSTYAPGSENAAVVTGASAGAKTTGAGPLITRHATRSVEPAGRPSSVADPSSVITLSGGVIDRSGPALTDGRWFSRETVRRTSSMEVRAPSLAVRRRTYSPSAENVTLVTAVDGEPNTTGAGPLI